jgi:diguanylate cyclase (GGDEF)-like protein
MLASCVRVVETGDPMVLERSAVIRQMLWYHMQLAKLGDGVGLTVRDVTLARHATEEIRHQATHDPLTGLSNRAGFELALTSAITEAQHSGHITALALLDLDDFKRINDNLGHAAGDQVLQHVATRLRDCVRPNDTVARLGGDEFVLVLPSINYPAGAEIVARKLIAQIALPMQVDGNTVTVTVSVGISALPQDGSDAAILLKSADHAMYSAKRAGRNRYALHDTAPG